MLVLLSLGRQMVLLWEEVSNTGEIRWFFAWTLVNQQKNAENKKETLSRDCVVLGKVNRRSLYEILFTVFISVDVSLSLPHVQIADGIVSCFRNCGEDAYTHMTFSFIIFNIWLKEISK